MAKYDGTNGDDVHSGTAGKDKIKGKDGNDFLDGLAGNDDIKGGDGNDTLIGGLGHDKLDGGKGDDSIEGGAGNDDIKGGKGFDTAVYEGSIFDFTVESTGANDDDDDDDGDGPFGDKLIVTDNNLADGDQGTDEVKHVEAIQFDDFTLFVDGTNNGPVLLGGNQSTDEDTPSSFDIDGFDFDGDTLTVDSLTVTGAGLLSITGSAALTPGFGSGVRYSLAFDPNGGYESLAVGESATETASLTVSDGNGGTQTLNFDIVVNGANDAPVASPVNVAADEDGPAVAIAGAFSDVDGSDTHSFAFSGATGTVTDNGDGSFSYDPAGQFESLAVGETATDSFSYTVTDNNGASDTETVTVTITGENDDPDAVDDSGVGFSTNEDTAFVTGNVLLNDNDVDASDMLGVLSIDTTGTLGLVTDNGDGTFGYDPNGQFESLSPGDTKTDSFAYTVSDGNGGTDTATVTIVITGVADDPVAMDDGGPGYTTNEDTAFVTGNVLLNDNDPNPGDILSVAGVDTTGTLGLVTDNGDGTFGYDPNGAFESLAAGESATDTFAYTVSDGMGGTDTANVTITVEGLNDAPTAEEDFETTNTGVPVIVNVLGNDTDPDASDTLSIDSFTQPIGGGGTVTDNGDGTLTFTPDPGVTGLFEFEYTVSDGNGGTDTGTVAVEVTEPQAGNAAPIARSATIEAVLDDGAPGNVLTLDFNTLTAGGQPIISDPDGNPLDITAISIVTSRGSSPVPFVETAPGSNIFTLDLDGLGVADGVTGEFTVEYTVDDGQGAANSAATGLIELVVENPAGGGGNTPPVAGDDTITRTEADGQIVINLADPAGLSSDPDGDSLTVVGYSFTDASGNPLRFDPLEEAGTGLVGGTMTLDPDAFGLGDGETGTFLLTYTVSDGKGGTDTGVVTLNLTGSPGNTAPVALPGAETRILPDDIIPFSDGNDDIAFDLNPLVSDAEFDPLTISVTAITTDAAGITPFDPGVNDLGLPGLDFTVAGGIVTLTSVSELGLVDGDSLDLFIQYEVSDGSLTSSGTVAITVADPAAPPAGFDRTVDFENSVIETPPADPIADLDGIRIDGAAFAVDTSAGGGRGLAPGIVAGQTTPGGQFVARIVGQEDGTDGLGNPLYSFEMYSEGGTAVIGTSGFVNFLQTAEDLFGPAYDLNSMSLTLADGPGETVTIKTFRHAEVAGGFNEHQHVEVGSFDIAVSSTSPTLLDFTTAAFTDALIFDDPTTTGIVETGAFESIVAVQFITTGDLILSDPANPLSELTASNDDTLVIDDLVFDFV